MENSKNHFFQVMKIQLQFYLSCPPANLQFFLYSTLIHLYEQRPVNQGVLKNWVWLLFILCKIRSYGRK